MIGVFNNTFINATNTTIVRMKFLKHKKYLKYYPKQYLLYISLYSYFKIATNKIL